MVKLIWSPRALKDLEIIYEYINPDSIDNARYFIQQLLTSATEITEFPFSGRYITSIEKIELSVFGGAWCRAPLLLFQGRQYC